MKSPLKTRRRALLGAGAALALTPLTACSAGAGGQAAPPIDTGANAEVVFMRTANASLAQAYDAQAASFNAKQSKIKGRFEAATIGQGETWEAKLTTMIAAGSPPDTFVVPQEFIPNFAANGTLLDLDPYIARDAKEVDTADFFPAHLQGGKWKNKQVLLPPDGCALLTYYNVTLFQEAGVPVPRPTWNWSDYLDAARRLTKRDSNGQITQVGAMPIDGNNQFWIWLWSNGADLLSDDFTQVKVTEKPALDAVQFVADMVQRHGVTQMTPGVSLPNMPHIMGRVGMWTANRGFFGQLQNVTTFKVNVVPAPRSPQTNQSTTIANPGYIGIWKGHKRPDVAWQWLKFLTSTEALNIRSRVQMGGCPSRKSATQDPVYTQNTFPALESTSANKAFADVLNDPKMARFVPNYVGMGDATVIYNKYFTAAIKGEQALSSAMETAKREIEDVIRRRPQPTT